MNVLVFIQTDEMKVNRLSIEAVCAAQSLKAETDVSVSAVCQSPESIDWAKDKNIDTIYINRPIVNTACQLATIRTTKTNDG